MSGPNLWKSIRGFLGYSVSKTGQVSRHKRVFGGGESRHVLRLIHHKGFVFCRIYREGKRYDLPVHVLVADHFLSPPQDERRLFFVTHIDGDYTHNHYRNLRYVYDRGNKNNAEAIWLASQKQRLERDYRITI